MPLDLVAPPATRSPWQLFYSWILERRRDHWRRRSRRLPRPVLSVGNLHWGGAGKTPLVAALAAHLRDGGRRVAILSRGYGSKRRGVRVVSRGEGALLGPDIAGDEPVQLASQLPGVTVVVEPERYRAGRYALEQLSPPPDVFLLDDAFSHVRLARDLDLLAFPATDPWAGGRLAPSGRLREPLAATRHADAVLLTSADPPAGEHLAKALRLYGFDGPGFASRTVAEVARLTTGEPLSPNAEVVLLCGIARPDRFRRSAAEAGFRVVSELVLEDHHAYGDSTLRRIRRLWEEHPADAVLTTSKDLVKLRGRLDLPLAELPVEARPEPAFWRWLDERLAELEGTE